MILKMDYHCVAIIPGTKYRVGNKEVFSPEWNRKQPILTYCKKR